MCVLKKVSCILLLLFVLHHSTSATIQACGLSLDEFLESVCVNGFNSKILRAKRIDPSTGLMEPSALSSLFTDNAYDYNNMLAKTRRRRHKGVAEECCRKSCTMSEVLAYCK